MTRNDFFKDVLTKGEYATISKAFDEFEERANDLISEVRAQIEGIMETLYKKKTSTEFVGKNFTLINRIDDINSVDKLFDILCEFV